MVSQNQFTVQGTVFAANGITAKSAQVNLQNQKTETDAAGQFRVSNIKEGEWQLTVFLQAIKIIVKK
jgi:hypothetical protein